MRTPPMVRTITGLANRRFQAIFRPALTDICEDTSPDCSTLTCFRGKFQSSATLICLLLANQRVVTPRRGTVVHQIEEIDNHIVECEDVVAGRVLERVLVRSDEPQRMAEAASGVAITQLGALCEGAARMRS